MAHTGLEKTVLKGLVNDEVYTRKVIAYLKPEYFQDIGDRTVFKIIQNLFEKYNTIPTLEMIEVESGRLKGINEHVYDKISNSIIELYNDDEMTKSNTDWLVQVSEEFCKEQALYNAISATVQIFEGSKKDVLKTEIPTLMKEALAVGFDVKMGHDYFADAAEQYKYYHEDVAKIPFYNNTFNDITNNGATMGTINLFVASTHGGKSAMLCDLAAGYLKQGEDVLYITLEMSEKEIRKRIDANLLEIPLDSLKDCQESIYINKINSIRKRYTGNLKIKQFPTASANVSDFRRLLEEYKLKLNFKPKAIIVDYLGIMTSERFRGGNIKEYGYYKAITEELRGLMIEFDAVGWSGVQLNRQGSKSDNPDATDIADSYGIMFAADFSIIINNSPELREMGQVGFKQVKNRYKNLHYKELFSMNMEWEYMTLRDLDETKPIFDGTDIGKRMNISYQEDSDEDELDKIFH